MTIARYFFALAPLSCKQRTSFQLPPGCAPMALLHLHVRKAWRVASLVFFVALILAMSYLLHRQCGPLSYTCSLCRPVVHELFCQLAEAGLVVIRGARAPGLTQGRLKH